MDKIGLTDRRRFRWPARRRQHGIEQTCAAWIAIVGTGVIGASWAAEFLAHGSMGRDGSGAECRTNLRSTSSGLASGSPRGTGENASRERLTFSVDLKRRCRRGPCSGKWPGTAGFFSRSIVRRDRRGYRRFDHASSSSGITMSVTQSRVRTRSGASSDIL